MKKVWVCHIAAAGVLMPALAFAAIEQSTGQTEMEHLMPLYEIWILDRLCSSTRYQAETGLSKMSCIRQTRNELSHCAQRFRNKIPRNDSQEIDGRLRYRDFIAGFTRCLKEQARRRDQTVD
jgi:hypothetical protein